MSEMQFKYFSDFQCEMCLPWVQLTNRLEVAMKQFSKGEVTQPVRTTLKINEADGTSFLMMPCYSPADNIISCKLICMYPQNQKRYGLSTHIVYIVVFDATTGKLLSLMDAEGITKRRTSAASALSARWLLQKDPQVLAVCGSGHQAYSHIQVLVNQYRETLKEIKIWNHRIAGAEKMAVEISGWLSDSIKVKVCKEVGSCVKDADMVVTATFSPEAYIQKEMIKKGAHIMSVGSVGPTLSELHPDLMNSSEVYVDSYAGASIESGDVIKSNCTIKAELGEVIAGTKFGRTCSDSVTIYKSLGLAVQDLAAAKLILDVSELSASEVPINIVKREAIKTKNEALSTDVKTVNTTCKADRVTFICAAKFYLNHDTTACEVMVKQNEDDSVCTGLCFLYNSKNGQLVAIIDDWKASATEETKIKIISSFNNR